MGHKPRELIEASVEWDGTLLAVGHFPADAAPELAGLDEMALEGMALEGIALKDLEGMQEALGRLAPGDAERVGPLSLSLRYVACEEPAPRKSLAWAPLAYVSGVMVLAGLFVALMALVPPQGQAFSIPAESLASRSVPFTTLAPAALFEETRGEAREGETGMEWGEQGLAGTPTAEDTAPRRRSVRNSDAPAPRAAPERAGVLSLGAMFEGVGASESPFAQALGTDTNALLGSLTASVSGESFGFGGLGMTSTGRHGGGGGLGTVPLLGGRGFGASSGGACGCGLPSRYTFARGSHSARGGQIRSIESAPEPTRAARVPRLRSSRPEVRGALDPSLIRRVVRRHTNETRHCFERALQSQPNLEGRIQAQFIISPDGAVTTANIQSSTLRHQAAEACVLSVVRRMTFPATPHGNISIVTYPWVFSAV